MWTLPLILAVLATQITAVGANPGIAEPTSWGKLKTSFLQQVPTPEMTTQQIAQTTLEEFPGLPGLTVHRVAKIRWTDNALCYVVAATSGTGDQARAVVAIMTTSFKVISVHSAGPYGAPPTEHVTGLLLPFTADDLADLGNQVLAQNPQAAGGVLSLADDDGDCDCPSVARTSTCGALATSAAMLVAFYMPGEFIIKTIAAGLTYGLVTAACMSDDVHQERGYDDPPPGFHARKAIGNVRP